jgi:hypothetical protein
VGTDFTWEEANEGPPSLPQEFNVSYLGKRKILALVHVVQEALANCGTPTSPLPKYYYPTAKSIVPWAMPALGKWELRDVYVIEMKRLPAFDSGYCYSNRVLYIDTETYFPLATELYDRDGKLYKFLFEFLMPLRVPQTRCCVGGEWRHSGFDREFQRQTLDDKYSGRALLQHRLRRELLRRGEICEPPGVDEDRAIAGGL